MSENADEFGTGRDDPTGHLEQSRVVRLQATAMVIAVQFDEDRWRHAGGFAHAGQGVGLFHAIEQQFHIGAGSAAKLHGPPC